jgi:putative phosphoserine phosphatase/1-acylglycerol-3-phosphate O-acyltransferase
MAVEQRPPDAGTDERAPIRPGEAGGAVFVDLDRTLLRGASGLVLSVAMHAEGLFEGRPSIPGERIFYGFYDIVGETLPFMGMVRAAARFVRGWPVEAVQRAGAVAAPELAALVQPYAPAVLAEHRAAGRRLVLATTSPVDLIGPTASSTCRCCAPSATRARSTRIAGCDWRPGCTAGPSSAGTGRRGCPRWAASSPTTCCATWCGPRSSPTRASTSPASSACRCGDR